MERDWWIPPALIRDQMQAGNPLRFGMVSNQKITFGIRWYQMVASDLVKTASIPDGRKPSPFLSQPSGQDGDIRQDMIDQVAVKTDRNGHHEMRSQVTRWNPIGSGKG